MGSIIATSKNMVLRKLLSTALVTTMLCYSGVANAQLEQQTGVADPGRLDRTLGETQLVPQVAPDISVKSMALQAAPEGAENIKFNFGGLRIEGASAYGETELTSMYQGMIGTEITLADLYALANRMTLKYRNDGYILTQVVVPPQTIEDGIARLRVVEGFIDNVIIQGDGSQSELDIIQKYASNISTGGPLNIADMERYLLLINDLTGLSARSVISPSASTPGAADLLVILGERDPYEALVGINNHGSRYLGPVQFSGVGVVNSALGFNESITAQLVLAPDSGMELAYGSLTYEQPVGPYGTTVSIGGSVTSTDPGFDLRQFDVTGLSQSMTLRVEHPVVRSRTTNIFAHGLFDWRNVDSKNNVEPTRKDRIRAVRAGMKAEFLDRLLGVAVNSVSLQLSQGLDILGSSDEGDANLTRATGDPTFTKANIELQRLQRVTSTVNVLLKGRGQLSNNPLLSSEEFGLGGIGTIRGFDPSEVVGDDGIGGSVEVQWDTPVEMAQLFGFLDSGTVWNQDATNSGDKRTSLTSTGGGVRLDLPMEVDAEFIAAFPLHRDIQTQGEHDPQFFFSLNKKF
ncbi:MAG: ShlB/FhaC/HecB family hemolysin secretion/activation protein [Alphaproteobacteria bacterium]|nr:ShlB/FhaC/HecB family hemolysin secretion/activation protein [Alphaproteobacteria bacterium]